MNKTLQAGNKPSVTKEIYRHVTNADMNFIKNLLD